MIEIERWGDCAIVAMNNPKQRNALSLAMADSLRTGLEEAARTSRAIVLTGRGGHFCSGAELGAHVDPERQDYDSGLPLETHFNPLMRSLRAVDVPIVAALDGAVAGIGVSLAAACDVLIATNAAYFFTAFTRIGLVPDGGCMHLLIHAIGRPRAMEMAMADTPMEASRALDWGLVNRVVGRAELMQHALTEAARLAAGPTLAYGLLRALSFEACESSFETSLARERAMQCDAGRTADHRSAIDAFRRKLVPQFEGR